MRAIAVYNMKGGVGKTTAAVNLSYLAAAAGQRVLLWDLDPQGASSFAFRVRPRISGFGKKSFESGEAFGTAIKETDYDNLDLVPADFAYRKFDRLLDDLGEPECVITGLLETLGRDYDTVFLDCPAGFSLLIEGVVCAVDLILVPTIPNVLSLRTVARLVKWADRSDSSAQLAAFFNMVDRRKALHRRACELSASHREVFLTGRIPYASVVEQMALRRAPVGVFATRDCATLAFREVWSEVQARFEHHGDARPSEHDRWAHLRRTIESLIVRLESPDEHQLAVLRQSPAIKIAGVGGRSAPEADSVGGGNRDFVHSFDTERLDLKRRGHVLELHERQGNLLVVAGRSGGEGGADTTRWAEAQIDGSWALQILAGNMSPLAALDRRLGRPGPRAVENVRAIVGELRLRRIESRLTGRAGSKGYTGLSEVAGGESQRSTVR